MNKLCDEMNRSLTSLISIPSDVKKQLEELDPSLCQKVLEDSKLDFSLVVADILEGARSRGITSVRVDAGSEKFKEYARCVRNAFENGGVQVDDDAHYNVDVSWVIESTYAGNLRGRLKRHGF